MAEKKGLSHTAYGGIKGDEYVPFIPASQAMPELTIMSIIVGCLFAVIFGAANTYLGMKIGMTIAAGIPAAILASGLFKGILKNNNILEVNTVQAMAAMGESLAGGLIFTIPAVILFKETLTLPMIVLVGLLGGLVGIIFVVPLRRYLIVEEHGKLIYPEGMATSEVLVSSNAGGTGFKTMMTGFGVGAVYKLITEAFLFFNYEVEWEIKSYQKTIFGLDAMASLVGVGFIVGIEVALYMFSGALVAYFVLIPMIKYFGAGLVAPLFPSAALIKDMSANAIRGSYIRYIGAGTVATGGLIGIIKSMPTIVKSFKSAMSGIGAKGGIKRTEKDVPMTWVIAGAILVFILAWLLPGIKVGFVGAILVIICSFFFAVVSARLVGLIGTTNNPISGMTIASLLVIASALKATGQIGTHGMVVAILAGGMVCVAIAIAGGTAQSLKATYIVGGTPKYLEIGMYVAVAAATVAIGGVILMINSQYGIGSKEFGAPQASMMQMIVSGIMNAQLPWVFVIMGVFIGVVLELIHIPILPFALGLYLPIHLSSGVLFGGIIKWLVDRKYKNDQDTGKERVERGVLLSSGLVAGDAIVGVLIAFCAYLNFADKLQIGPKILPEAVVNSPWTTLIVLLILCAWIYSYITKKEVKVVQSNMDKKA